MVPVNVDAQFRRLMLILGYIDPGFGLLVWQAILGAFFGLLFYLKKTRRWIVTTFQRIFSSGKPNQGTLIKEIEPTGPKGRND